MTMFDDRSSLYRCAVDLAPDVIAQTGRLRSVVRSTVRHTVTLVLSLFVAVGTATAAPNLAEYKLMFSDEFSGSRLNASKWNTGLLWGPYQPINNEEQFYVDMLGMHKRSTHNPFELTGSSLKITATPVGNGVQPPLRPGRNNPVWKQFSEYRFNGATADGPGYQASDVKYLSGIITSYDSFRFTHGYIESRVKLPAGRGLWPAFWALNSFYVEDVPEIDVMEFIGHQTDRVYHTYHYFQPHNNWLKTSTPSYTTQIEDFTQDWHTFGMEWGPKEIIWYVDGVQAQRVDASQYDIANQAMYLLANLAVGGNWPGSPDANTEFPATYEIDYIRAYQRKPPAVITRAKLASDFELMFQDNFSGSSLSRNRWNSSYLWGPYFPVNAEEQIYPDMLGEHRGYQHNPFSLKNGILSITAKAVPEAELPAAPGLNSSQFSNNPSWQSGLGYRDPRSSTYYAPEYVSGVLTSYDAFKFVDGYAEIRAKLPRGAGLWSNFKLLNAYYVDQRPEIGVMDAVGQRRTEIKHFNHYDEQGRQSVDFITSGGDFTAGFHRYGVHWQKGRIDWYIDGKIVQTTTGPGVSSQMMYIVVNLAVGGNVAGNVNRSALPRSLQVDYVRVWQQKLPKQVANNNGGQGGSGASDSDDGSDADADAGGSGGNNASNGSDDEQGSGSTEGSDSANNADAGNTPATASPQLLEPVDGNVVEGAQVTARWRANTTSVTEWWLRAGSQRLGRNYFDSQRISSASTTARVVRNLPQDGSIVYLTLYYKTAKGGWANVESSFTSKSASQTGNGSGQNDNTQSSGDSENGSVQPSGGMSGASEQSAFPTFSSPTDNASLAGASSVFRWSAGRSTVTQWWLKVGSVSGGEDYFSSGRITSSSTSSILVTGLPRDGSRVFATLYYKGSDGSWNATQTTFTSVSSGNSGSGGGASDGSGSSAGDNQSGEGTGSDDAQQGGSVSTPQLLFPLRGSDITARQATFRWTANTTDVRQWWLRVGTAPAKADYFDSDRIENINQTQIRVTGLPAAGTRVYVTLYHRSSAGKWNRVDKQFIVGRD